MLYVCCDECRTTGYRPEVILCWWAWLMDGFCGEACMTDIIHSACLITTSAIHRCMSTYPVWRYATRCHCSYIAYVTLVVQVEQLVQCVYKWPLTYVWHAGSPWHCPGQVHRSKVTATRWKMLLTWLVWPCLRTFSSLSFLIPFGRSCNISKAPVLRLNFFRSIALYP